MISYFALYGVIFVLGILLLMFQKKKKLTDAQKKKYILYLSKIENNPSLSQQIIEYDKLYHTILKAYGYKGTFGEILKKKPNIITDLQKVWELHKLRNTIVHELINLPEPKLEKASDQYAKQIQKLLFK